ncbi:MAG: DUF4434 domain-containing protein [Victivallaceae bacterium]|nr:DUF4434 domain-containing protein [Victivallaceae bacterium]
MYNIVDIEDFSLFTASQRAIDMIEPKIAKAKLDNKEFLAENPQRETSMTITGTFIYAHPPNYYGQPMHNYRLTAWIKLIRELKEIGMDTVILQASIWNELDECYYPSKHFNYTKNWNVVEPMLEAAEIIGIQVFLGGYGSATGWRDDLTPEIIQQEKSNQKTCFKELLQLYQGRFTGIYFAPETAYFGERDQKKEAFLNDLYRDFCNEVKSTDQNIQILMSPATKYFPDKLAEMTDSWLAIMQDVPLDIMAPQDSIGTCGNLLRHQLETYKIWHEICQQQEIEFWSNIEIFERKAQITGTYYNMTANPQRVAAQINHAAPYAKKLICWEAPYYLANKGDERSLALKQYLQQIN